MMGVLYLGQQNTVVQEVVTISFSKRKTERFPQRIRQSPPHAPNLAAMLTVIPKTNIFSRPSAVRANEPTQISSPVESHAAESHISFLRNASRAFIITDQALGQIFQRTRAED